MKKFVLIFFVFFTACGDNSAAPINGINGTDGTNGANGQAGPPGANGTNGTDNHIVQSILCQGYVAVSSNAAYNLTYQETTTDYGDVWADACLNGTSFGVCNSSEYANGQQGSTTGHVQITLSSTGVNDSGWWSFDLQSITQLNVVYHDADLGGKGELNFVVNTCTVNNFQ